MKARNIQEMIRAKEKIERGSATPAKVWDVRSDGKGGFTRQAVDPSSFRRAQKMSSGKEKEVMGEVWQAQKEIKSADRTANPVLEERKRRRR
ncbi:MAG: hypothetical protein JWR69_2351 [Pedosphaera sp.]|nr:hypothetical protein [Pedosphaera sp.]